jgi:uncharacterized membrane protein YeiH
MDVAEYAGTVVFAVSGVLAVSRGRLDWFGALVVGVVTALGGGTIRDVILGNTPVFWVGELEYLAAATAGALIAIPIASSLAAGPARRFDETLQVADAAGLALFAIVGASITLELGFNGGVAVATGVITGAGGGVIRDLLADRTPLVLRGEIYATAALAGTAVFVALDELTAAPETIAAVLGGALVFGLRTAGIRRQWSLPAVAGPAD